MQKLLSLIITAGIIYMLVKNTMGNVEIPKSATPKEENNSTERTVAPELTGNFLEKTISSVLVNVLKTDEGKYFLENLIQPMNGPLAGSEVGFKMNNDDFINAIFKITTYDKGEKGPASCGHLVTVHYKVTTIANLAVDEKTITFPLGSNKSVPGMDAVIVGMKTGQTRQATIASKYFSNLEKHKNGSFKLTVTLKDIAPDNFINDSVKIFDDRLAYKIPMLCGGNAIYDVKITNLSRNLVIYNSVNSGKKISMQIGDLNYPMIFSHSLHNKVPIGVRTVITKGNYLKSYASEYSRIFPETKIPEDEYFMIEFSNFVGP